MVVDIVEDEERVDPRSIFTGSKANGRSRHAGEFSTEGSSTRRRRFAEFLGCAGQRQQKRVPNVRVHIGHIYKPRGACNCSRTLQSFTFFLILYCVASRRCAARLAPISRRAPMRKKQIGFDLYFPVVCSLALGLRSVFQWKEKASYLGNV